MDQIRCVGGLLLYLLRQKVVNELEGSQSKIQLTALKPYSMYGLEFLGQDVP